MVTKVNLVDLYILNYICNTINCTVKLKFHFLISYLKIPYTFKNQLLSPYTFSLEIVAYYFLFYIFLCFKLILAVGYKHLYKLKNFKLTVGIYLFN